jgi:hypothetical protein
MFTILLQYLLIAFSFFTGAVLFFFAVYLTARMFSLGILKTLEKGVSKHGTRKNIKKEPKEIRQSGTAKENKEEPAESEVNWQERH